MLVEEQSAEEGIFYTAKAKYFEGYKATAEDITVLIEEGMSPIYLAYMPEETNVEDLTVTKLKQTLDELRIPYGSKDTKDVLVRKLVSE